MRLKLAIVAAVCLFLCAFRFLYPQDRAGYLAVLPGTYQAQYDVLRGQELTWIYHVRNDATVPQQVELVGKSCSCIRTTLSNSTIQPGEIALVQAKQHMPLVGDAHGAVYIATNLGARVALTFRASPRQYSGLQVAPEDVSLRFSTEVAPIIAINALFVIKDALSGIEPPPRVQCTSPNVTLYESDNWRRVTDRSWATTLRLRISDPGVASQIVLSCSASQAFVTVAK